MSKKVPYLETSPATSQRKDGNGSSSTGSPTPTGKRTAAILQAPADSSSPTDNPLSTPWDDTSKRRVQTWADVVQADLDQWREEQMEKWHENSGNLPASGERGVSDLELLQFWETRIPVRQKG